MADSAAVPAAGSRAAGTVLVLAGAAGFSSLAILAKLVYAHDASVLTALAARYTVAAVVTGVAAWLALGSFRPPRRTAHWPAMGVLNALAALCFWSALRLDDVSRVAPITYVFPVLVAMLAPLALRERVSARTWTAVGLAIAGSTLLLGNGLGRPGSAGAAGLAFASAVATAFFYLTAGRATSERDWLLASSTVFTVGALVFVPVAVASGWQFPTGRGWLYLALIITVGTIAPFFMFFAGMARIGPTRAAVLSIAEPVLIVLLAFIVLDERLGVYQAVGITLVLASFALATVSGARRVLESGGRRW